MRHRESLSSELLPGTLEMLILKTLTRRAAHGYAIARHLERVSDDVLRVGESSLYPALQRLERKGWISSGWEDTERGRPMKFYRLTAAGRKQLAVEASRWNQLAGAIARVMRPA